MVNVVLYMHLILFGFKFQSHTLDSKCINAGQPSKNVTNQTATFVIKGSFQVTSSQFLQNSSQLVSRSDFTWRKTTDVICSPAYFTTDTELLHRVCIHRHTCTRRALYVCLLSDRMLPSFKHSSHKLVSMASNRHGLKSLSPSR